MHKPPAFKEVTPMPLSPSEAVPPIKPFSCDKTVLSRSFPALYTLYITHYTLYGSNTLSLEKKMNTHVKGLHQARLPACPCQQPAQCSLSFMSLVRHPLNKSSAGKLYGLGIAPCRKHHTRRHHKMATSSVMCPLVWCGAVVRHTTTSFSKFSCFGIVFHLNAMYSQSFELSAVQ